MKQFCRNALCVLSFLGALSLPVCAAELWVAPNGGDTNAATRENPLASVDMALRKARELRRFNQVTSNGPVKIILRGGEPRGRWLLTFVFGLIHGFGFASGLRELGVGANGSSLAGPLISFNLGVELGQIAIAAIVLPLIWKLRTQPMFVHRWVPACSTLVALLGGFWFVQRVWF